MGGVTKLTAKNVYKILEATQQYTARAGPSVPEPPFSDVIMAQSLTPSGPPGGKWAVHCGHGSGGGDRAQGGVGRTSMEWVGTSGRPGFA